MPNPDLVQLGSLVTREQHTALKALSEKNHVPMGVLVREAISAMLKKYQAKEGAK